MSKFEETKASILEGLKEEIRSTVRASIDTLVEAKSKEKGYVEGEEEEDLPVDGEEEEEDELEEEKDGESEEDEGDEEDLEEYKNKKRK